VSVWYPSSPLGLIANCVFVDVDFSVAPVGTLTLKELAKGEAQTT
jgi:hypothetical protein